MANAIKLYTIYKTVNKINRLLIIITSILLFILYIQVNYVFIYSYINKDPYFKKTSLSLSDIFLSISSKFKPKLFDL